MLEAMELSRTPVRSSEALRRLSRRAAELAEQGKHAGAARVWEELDQLEPYNEAVAAGLGAALLAAGDNRKAAYHLAKACERHTSNALLLRLHAQALLKLGDSASAVGALYLALELDPGSPAVCAALGNALHQQRQPGPAFRHAAVAFEAEPVVANAALLSSILFDLGEEQTAMAVVDAVEDGGPEFVSKLVLRSLCLRMAGRVDEALSEARRAVAVAPDNSHAMVGLGMVLLARGELTPEAWHLYDSRASLIGVGRWPAPERRWTGEDLTGRTLLVHAEQGFGDTLQFGRYLPLLAARCDKVIFAIQPGLLRLLRGTPGAQMVVSGGPELPEFDKYVPLLSLPGLLGTTLDTIPPPLQLPLPHIEPPSDGRLHVGLVWAGNGIFVDDARRSLDPAHLSPLADVEGVVFHNLQLGAKALPLPAMVDDMHRVSDFHDTAQIVAGLDLVIAVDTSVAHLAATMGKQVWLLARKQGCWRWLEGRDDSPWYPSVRLYRQERLSDWTSVIARVKNDLAARVTVPAPDRRSGVSVAAPIACSAPPVRHSD